MLWHSNNLIWNHGIVKSSSTFSYSTILSGNSLRKLKENRQLVFSNEWTLHLCWQILCVQANWILDVSTFLTMQSKLAGHWVVFRCFCSRWIDICGENAINSSFAHLKKNILFSPQKKIVVVSKSAGVSKSIIQSLMSPVRNFLHWFVIENNYKQLKKII